MNKKNIGVWSLYDFANSIIATGFFLYFSQWLVIDNKVADIWFNLLFVASSTLLIATAPVISSIADKMSVGMIFLKITTVFLFITALLMSLAAVLLPPTKTNLIITCIFFILANYSYQFTYAFYNPMLNIVASPKARGKVSGIGGAAGWVGSIVGGIITLPFAIGAVYLFGSPGRAQTFLPATLGFFIFALPMLLFFKEPNKPKKIVINLANEYRNFFKSFMSLLKIPGVGIFLLGFFFFIDAILTAQNNFPIFLQQIYHISDTTKSIVLALALVGSVLGSLIIGWIADYVGLKRTLIGLVCGWIVNFLVMAVLNDLIIFSVLLFASGFLLGATWAVSRAILVSLTPQEKLNSAFSYYEISEKCSTLIGPLAWGLITFSLTNHGELRYRVAMASMTVFVLLGLLMIKKIPSKI